MADYTVKPISLDLRPQWDALWNRSDRHLGLHWDFIEAAATGCVTPVRLGVFDKGNRLLAGMPFVERKERGMRTWRAPSPASVGGILVEKDADQNEGFLRDVLSALGSDVSTQVPAATQILPPSQLDGRGLAWQGWRLHFHYNYVHHIKSPDFLLSASESSARRQGKKAKESGLEFRTGVSLLPQVREILEETQKRQAIPEHVHWQAFETMANEGCQGKWDGIQGWVAGIIDPQNEELLAGGIFLQSGDRVSYVLGASKSTEQGTGAPSLLHFELTNHLFAEMGPFTYDWVGANTASVAQFKRKFRPELEISCRAIWQSRLAAMVFRWG